MPSKSTAVWPMTTPPCIAVTVVGTPNGTTWPATAPVAGGAGGWSWITPSWVVAPASTATPSTVWVELHAVGARRQRAEQEVPVRVHAGLGHRGAALHRHHRRRHAGRRHLACDHPLGRRQRDQLDRADVGGHAHLDRHAVHRLILVITPRVEHESVGAGG